MSYSDEELKIDNINEEDEDLDDTELSDSVGIPIEEDDFLDDEFIGLKDDESDEY